MYHAPSGAAHIPVGEQAFIAQHRLAESPQEAEALRHGVSGQIAKSPPFPEKGLDGRDWIHLPLEDLQRGSEVERKSPYRFLNISDLSADILLRIFRGSGVIKCMQICRQWRDLGWPRDVEHPVIIKVKQLDGFRRALETKSAFLLNQFDALGIDLSRLELGASRHDLTWSERG